MKAEMKANILLIILLIVMFMASGALSGDKPGKKSQSDSLKAGEKISESLVFEWPEEGKWKSEFVHTYDKTTSEYFYPAGQSSTNWIEMGSVEIVEGKKNFNIPGTARIIYLSTQKGSPDATWDIIKKGYTETKRPFIIFEIICPDFLSGEPAQVQLWKIIAGKTSQFIIQYSHRGKEITDSTREKILEILKKADIKAEIKVEG
jgi:hypothetical protein